jgi:hypothetical protein
MAALAIVPLVCRGMGYARPRPVGHA